jgi:hypothetical protein
MSEIEIGPDDREIVEYDYQLSDKSLLSGIQPGERVAIINPTTGNKTVEIAPDSPGTYEVEQWSPTGTITGTYEVIAPENATVQPVDTRMGWNIPDKILSAEQLRNAEWSVSDQQKAQILESVGIGTGGGGDTGGGGGTGAPLPGDISPMILAAVAIAALAAWRIN